MDRFRFGIIMVEEWLLERLLEGLILDVLKIW